MFAKILQSLLTVTLRASKLTGVRFGILRLSFFCPRSGRAVLNTFGGKVETLEVLRNR